MSRTDELSDRLALMAAAWRWRHDYGMSWGDVGRMIGEHPTKAKWLAECHADRLAADAAAVSACPWCHGTRTLPATAVKLGSKTVELPHRACPHH
jgi:hypothetical protein